MPRGRRSTHGHHKGHRRHPEYLAVDRRASPGRRQAHQRCDEGEGAEGRRRGRLCGEPGGSHDARRLQQPRRADRARYPQQLLLDHRAFAVPLPAFGRLPAHLVRNRRRPDAGAAAYPRAHQRERRRHHPRAQREAASRGGPSPQIDPPHPAPAQAAVAREPVVRDRRHARALRGDEARPRPRSSPPRLYRRHRGAADRRGAAARVQGRHRGRRAPASTGPRSSVLRRRWISAGKR